TGGSGSTDANGAKKGSGGEGAAPTVDFTGRWRLTTATMLVLTQSGASVTGTWDYQGATVTGTVHGKVLELTTSSAQGVECSGTVTMDDSGRAFFGELTTKKPESERGRRFHFDGERVP